MAFDKFSSFNTSIQCFENVDRWDDDCIGEDAMEALKAKVMSAVNCAQHCDCTLVAIALDIANKDEIKEVWKFLKEIKDLKFTCHDAEENTTTLHHSSGKKVKCFFIFGGRKLIRNMLSPSRTL